MENKKRKPDSISDAPENRPPPARRCQSSTGSTDSSASSSSSGESGDRENTAPPARLLDFVAASTRRSLPIPGRFSPALSGSGNPSALARSLAGSAEVASESRTSVYSIVRNVFLSRLELLQAPQIYSHLCVNDENMGPEASGSRDGFLAFLGDYWSAVSQQNRSLEGTCQAVDVALRNVWQDQIDAAEVLAPFTCSHHKPCDVNMTIDDIRAAMQRTMSDDFARKARFVGCLPGFPALDANDRKILLNERGNEPLIIHRARHCKNGTYRFHFGASRPVHPCRYWLEGLELPGASARIHAFADGLNDLQLDKVETYVFVCVTFFRPASTTAKNVALLNFLYVHYLDLLRHLIGSRPTVSRRTDIFVRLDAMMESFAIMNADLNFAAQVAMGRNGRATGVT